MDFSKDYIAKLEQIGKLLKELESSFKKEGYNPPYSFPELEEHEKISFPTGYIRPVAYFQRAYEFSRYIDNDWIIRAICYSLQLLDVYSYFINRFDIALSAGKMFMKLGMIHVFSIFEGILYSATNVLNQSCYKENILCKNNAKCPFYIKKTSKLGFNGVIDCFIEKEILKIDEPGRELILKFKELRDNIHLHLINKNELDSGLYNIDNYNKMVSFILYLKSLPKLIEEFNEIKTADCKYG